MEQLSWASNTLEGVLSGNEELAAVVLSTAGESQCNTSNLKLVGYFSYPAGIGQIARWALRTLESSEIYPAIDRVFAVSDSYEYLSALLRRENVLPAFNASVLCIVNADQWQVHVMIPARVNVATQHVEAVWAWELERVVPHMCEVAASGEIARVHALSRWSAQAMAKVLPVPVEQFAPFDMDLIDGFKRRSSEATSLPSTTRYLLTSIDAKSLLSRKNPEGVLNLWNRVQGDIPEHQLILKSADLRDHASPELLDLIDNSARTVLIDEYLTDDD